MKRYVLAIVPVLLLLLAGLSFAATETSSTTTTTGTGEPNLQVSNYTVVPENVYPGTTGYVQITVHNSGDADAGSVIAYYDYEGGSTSLYVGDVSSGGTAQFPIPFKVSAQSAGGIQLVSVNIFYSYTVSHGTSSKQTSISVPLVVGQYNPLEVRTASMGRTAIAPGETLALELELRNTGGVVNGVVITTPANSSFSIEGTTQMSVGSISANATTRVSLSLVSSTGTETGTYTIPLVFTYQDALNRPTETTLYVGPVSVLESSTQYRVGINPLTPAEIGSEAVFELTLENMGASAISGTLDINSTEVFTPLGMQRLYFDSVPAGATVTRNITLGISSSTSAGYYTLPITLTTNTGQPATFNVGVAVLATPEITVGVDSSSGTTQVQIANTGNTQIRSVYVVARWSGSNRSSESFMGTLNVDDFASVAMDTTFQPSSSIDVEIRFKDSNNLPHIVRKTLPVGGTAGAAIGTQNGASAFRRNNTTGGPLGFLSNSGGSADFVTPVVILVVVVAVGYFAYRRFFAKK